ncbi:MAG: arylsulfatase [Bacteroidota bacterium]
MNRLTRILFVGLMLMWSACSQVANTASRPNIILILADDLGYGDLGCYGQTHFATPNLDQLAQEGMRFTQHYAGSPVCAPARCVLMTGKHTGHAFVRGNAQNKESFGQLPLPADEITIAKLLQANGYRTGAFGKWGLGNAGSSGDPLQHGFEQFFGYHDQVRAHNSYPEFLMDGSTKVMLRNEVQYLSDTLWHRGLGSVSTQKVDYSNDLILEKALDFIDQDSDRPFFLYFPTTIPHDNGEAEIGQRIEVPDASKFADRPWPADEKSYAALVEHLDGYLRRMREKLTESGQADNTIIIFTSDNGPLPSQALDSNGALQGHKRDLYEGGIRVPLIVHWPGQITGGESDHISGFQDFLPTLAEMAGIKDVPATDGLSFMGTLQGRGQVAHDYLYWEFHWWKSSKQAIRQGKWKAIRNGPEAPIELYDLRQDVGETTDLASQYPQHIARMDSLMQEARTSSVHFPMKP